MKKSYDYLINIYGKKSVSCDFKASTPSDKTSISKQRSDAQAHVEACVSQIAQTFKEIEPRSDTSIRCIPREHLATYAEYPNLASLAKGTVLQVEGVGFLMHYVDERMVVLVNGMIYQAGEDLQSKVHELTKNCYIKIVKIHSNCRRHIKYVECKVFKHDEWEGLIDYAKLPVFTKLDTKTCIIDVKTVAYKNQKRKVLLVEGGRVFKMKKSKLEEEIAPGYY